MEIIRLTDAEVTELIPTLAVGQALTKLGRNKYTISSVGPVIDVENDFADDAAADTGGIAVGGLYHTSGAVKVRIA